MSSVNNMLRQIKTIFKGRNVKPCLQPTELDFFYINDSEIRGKCILLETVEDETNLFKVINPSQKTIVLFAVDGCFIGKGKPPKHCDCIFFDDRAFCFAEMKFNSTTTSDLRMQDNRTEAISQLQSTINIFRTAFDNNFLGFELEAYVCTPDYYPKEDSSIKSQRIDFLENFGVKLFEKNERTFL